MIRVKREGGNSYAMLGERHVPGKSAHLVGYAVVRMV